MAELDQLRQEVRDGRIDSERLLDLLVTSQRQLHAAQQQLQAAHQRIEALEKQRVGSTTTKVEQPYSLRAEEQRQQARGKKKKQTKKAKKRRGRLTTADKVAQAERREPVFPAGVDPQDCKLSHVRPVWRVENGRAVLVAYEIYRGPQNRYGQIPGVLGRSEFGLEIVVEIAYLVYVMGLSFDKVCALVGFFQNVRLHKSQADALLQHLARHWENEFEVLCTLLAHSLIVHTDETSWSLNSVWAFVSEKARILLYGVPKDAATLKHLLDPATFAGLVISDDAAVYANFSAAQKCWAHLLRKAIKLTLQEPTNSTYRDFTDRLLEIFGQANRVQQDGRLGEAGRAQRVRDLEDELFALCGPTWFAELPKQEGPAEAYRLLVNELMRLLLAEQLFTFVTTTPVAQPNGETKPVSGTNNEAERTLRGAAEARKTGRTSKTLVGARRQTILTSVLESLRLYLPTFTASSVLEEITRWWEVGKSCFAAALTKLKIPERKDTVLDHILPVPSG